MLENKRVGIEAISVHIPYYAMDLIEMAQKHNIDVNKYYVGLNAHKIAVPHPQEDSVTMAINAGVRLFENYKIDKSDIGLVVVGTETAVDASKPISVHLLDALNLGPYCRTFDVQHACYGGTAALRLAASWIASSPSEKKALVITSDIARYPVGSAGEPTQGAAAVAMIVSNNPTVAEILPNEEAVYSRNTMDFWRPHYSRTAFVDGKYSIECYIESFLETATKYEKTSNISFDDYDYLLFHLPFPKIARKAHLAFYKKLNIDDWEKKEDQSWKNRAEHGIWAGKEVGNSYSSSLYVNLCALLERSNSLSLNGKTVAMYSYGSGLCSEFFALKLGNPNAWNGKIGLQSCLDNRIYISYDRYLDFRSVSEELHNNDNVLDEKRYGRAGEALFMGIRDHIRQYRYLSAEGMRKRKAA